MKTSPVLDRNLAALAPMLEATIKLLHPYAEGALHDLKTGKIVALYNNISRRNIGDPSVVTELGLDIQNFPDIFEPYYKTNWDGKKLKCTSVTVRDQSGIPVGLVCINFDTTAFEDMSHQLGAFLNPKTGSTLNPVEQFTENWRQQVAAFIAEYAAKNNLAPSALAKAEKSELVGQLYDHGYFNYRDAAADIARALKVSRTTVYNYLKDAK